MVRGRREVRGSEVASTYLAAQYKKCTATLIQLFYLRKGPFLSPAVAAAATGPYP